MSIHKVYVYEVQCCKCGDKITYDGQGVEYYQNKVKAKEQAKMLGWVFIMNNIYCPKCGENP